MTRLPPRPDLSWKDDGTPVDARFADVYYSVENGLAESRAVFLNGCDLPRAWQGRSHFTVAELGFGTGLNFLACWQAWAASEACEGWLHFVSFEGYPMDAGDARQALSAWPELSELAEMLCAAWPCRAKGVQQRVWPKARITLTLHIGCIEETLAEADFQADAWFLDGFSPARNGQMWGDALWPALAARSAPGARLATFTVAGQVRRGLADAGFRVAKRPGHGRKRERLEAVYDGKGAMACPAPQKTEHIAIVGAGIGGACLAHQLIKAGFSVTVYDAADGPGGGASGNPLALMMPRLDAADTAQARLLIDAYISAQRFYAGLPGVTPCLTLQRPRDASETARFAKVLEDPPLGRAQLEALPKGQLLHRQALIIEPKSLLPALLSGADLRWNETVSPDFARCAIGTERYDAIILANGHMLGALCPGLGLSDRLGQVNWLDGQPFVPASGLAHGHYALACGQRRLWGATFEAHKLAEACVTAQASEHNRRALEALAPAWEHAVRQVYERSDLSSGEQTGLQARASVRATTADRLPLIGAMPDLEKCGGLRRQFERRQWQWAKDDPVMRGIYIAGGFGSHGFTWGPWAAELLSGDLAQWPSPVRREARAIVAPGRQILRRMKRERQA